MEIMSLKIAVGRLGQFKPQINANIKKRGKNPSVVSPEKSIRQQLP
jgi:hypothetical protein